MLAFLRAHVTLRLLEQLPPTDVGGTASGRLSIQIRTPGGPSCHLTLSDGNARFAPTPRLLPAVTLFFPRPAHLVATLTGGKAPLIPLPGSIKAGRAIRAFRALTAALRSRIGSPEDRPRLLLLATLYAVEEVANRDAYVASRVARIGDGLILLRVAGDESVRAWIRKESGRITTGALGEGERAPEADAELEFADRQAAVDLLTGATPAMLALAERRVRLYGRLPMIQNLFPVLDRVSDYLGG